VVRTKNNHHSGRVALITDWIWSIDSMEMIDPDISARRKKNRQVIFLIVYSSNFLVLQCSFFCSMIIIENGDDFIYPYFTKRLLNCAFVSRLFNSIDE
jgi:hypothetical protein